MNEFYKSKPPKFLPYSLEYKKYEDAIDEEESYTIDRTIHKDMYGYIWYDEEILKQLENVKKCLKKARPKDYNNRGHQAELSINLEVIDAVIKLLKRYCFQNEE